eukprot:gene5151-57018_t
MVVDAVRRRKGLRTGSTPRRRPADACQCSPLRWLPHPAVSADAEGGCGSAVSMAQQPALRLAPLTSDVGPALHDSAPDSGTRPTVVNRRPCKSRAGNK